MTTDNAAPFPGLRSAYLRAIARAWRSPEYLQRLLAVSERESLGALRFLEQEFHFKFPFSVKFVLDDKHRPRWKPVGTTGWFGTMDEFKISLPTKPLDSADEASVLARYCAEFPTMLGAAIDGTSEAPADFAAFGLITARILALVWSDSQLANELYQAADARELVQKAMGCVVPWNFHLKFAEHPGPSSDSDEYWSTFPRSVITVHLPERPELGNGVQAIALAAYNGTGSPYPFTCA